MDKENGANNPPPPIRVLIVEDSGVYRELLTNIFQSSAKLQVIGIARNGEEAVRLTRRLKPDVITMDIHMPEVDGYEATRRIMSEVPCPIVMVTGSLNKNEHTRTFDAIQAGALSVLDKPTIDDTPEAFQHLISQICLLSEVRVVRRWSKPVGENAVAGMSKSWLPFPLPASQPKTQLIAIAASTGGPGALATLLGTLPAEFPIPILVVQHVTVGFGEGLAAWLDAQTPLKVRVAKHAQQLNPGEVLIAPDDFHMTVNSLKMISLQQTSPIHGLRPAADHLFHSVAKVYGDAAIGIILTGMGSDGAEGLVAMRKTGAHTIAQDEVSCVVFGMPAVAIELGAAEQVKPLDQIASAMMALIQE